MIQAQQQTDAENHPEYRSFKLGDWHITADTLRLRQGDKVIRLEPKVMQLLVFLVENQGKVVSREMLEEHVWGDMVVGYDAITNAILKLRKAMGDSARNPAYIETIPKTGYRLIAHVEKDDPGKQEAGQNNDQSHHAASQTWLLKPLVAIVAVILGIWLLISLFPPSAKESSGQLPAQPSIAVIPFLNIGNDPRQTWFSDGLSEDLMTELSKVSELFVIARNSSFKYKNKSIDVRTVANELGVRYILQGSVRRNTDHIRINVRLADSHSNENIWAERYDAPVDELFRIQDEVTRKIIVALSIRLTSKELQRLGQHSTQSLASYDEFLKGWERYWRFSRGDFAIAEKHFRKALEIDPENTRANAALALIYWQTWRQKWHENLGIPHAGWTRAIDEMEKAMRNPTPLAHSTKSAMLLMNRRYEKAIGEAEQAIALDANHASGYHALAEALSYFGQPGRAVEEARKGMRLDPNFVAPYLFIIGRSQLDMQMYGDAVESLQRAVKINPRDRDSRIALISALGHLNRLDQAQTVLDALNAENREQKIRRFTIDWLKNRWPYRKRNDRDHLIEGLLKAGMPEW